MCWCLQLFLPVQKPHHPSTPCRAARCPREGNSTTDLLHQYRERKKFCWSKRQNKPPQTRIGCRLAPILGQLGTGPVNGKFVCVWESSNVESNTNANRRPAPRMMNTQEGFLTSEWIRLGSVLVIWSFSLSLFRGFSLSVLDGWENGKRQGCEKVCNNEYIL